MKLDGLYMWVNSVLRLVFIILNYLENEVSYFGNIYLLLYIKNISKYYVGRIVDGLVYYFD